MTNNKPSDERTGGLERRETLLPYEVRRLLAPLHSCKQASGEGIARIRFFAPWARWAWYIAEYDGDDTLWGFVDAFKREYGYFVLSEIESLRGPGGLRVHRDRHFRPVRLGDLAAALSAWEG